MPDWALPGNVPTWCCALDGDNLVRVKKENAKVENMFRILSYHRSTSLFQSHCILVPNLLDTLLAFSLVEFKPRLERIIKEVIVVSEVATIAEELLKMDETGRDLDETEVKNATADRRTSRIGWKGVTFRREDTASMSSVDDEEFEVDESVRSSERTISRGSHPKLSNSESGSWRIKKFLDRWDDPIDKSDREPEVTIADVLKFRTALSYMDMTNPFGTAFGPASNRNECIESAHNVFYGLLKFSPHKSSIPFETLELAAVSEEEAITDAFVTKKDLHKVFRPDALHELTQLAFIQSIDAVYRKLRFFRASVGNASVIDKAKFQPAQAKAKKGHPLDWSAKKVRDGPNHFIPKRVLVKKVSMDSH